ncbi:hypothetical protein LTR62_004586 [Meristemomyces frigidus]|uniref:Mitochondrial carrier protein n=1 Tax=Meristemomyces frigidus TaxID=1508187 RepID=A0AAN7TED6_9PEZI|nr:hypothetical protein LTR62_004586 [Meristemomyces frigidus]
MTSPALLGSAVHRYGWSFLPNQVLPPMLANTVVGALLYTGYLQTLAMLHEPSARATKRPDPLPPATTTFAAGFVAGTVQSLIAAPLDALQVRFHAREFVDGKYKNMWQYGYLKSREIGARGIFAGWSLSLLRDSFGNAIFFSTFEYIKGQAFYAFVSNLYGQYGNLSGFQQDAIRAQAGGSAGTAVITPHYMIEPTFLLLAGMAASIAQAVIQYPISKLQEIHYGRLEWIDTHPPPSTRMRVGALGLYASAYRKSWKQCLALVRRGGGLTQWLYKDFLMRTITQVPSTSAGLIVFEVIRRKYGGGEDVVKINKDGYDILLV